MKERLTYLDAAKGIGLILIVCAHTGVDCIIPMLGSVKVALFFLLSGLFFTNKTTLGFKEYLVDDFKRIMIPFLFFYVISYFLFYVGKLVVPGFMDMTTANGILDCFTQKQYFNGPIWFLICLFWIRLICYLICHYILNEWLRAFLALGVGLLGYILGRNNIDLPLALDTAFTFTPILYFGMLSFKIALFERYLKIENGIFACIFYLSCIPVTISVSDSLNRYEGGGI